jgi:glycosyltransferase involved in cell wall biosynthesis
MLDQVRRHLHIAQVAPLYESVPPKRYGGTERVVAYLSDELVRRGHQVTLFASGNSTVETRIEAFRPLPLRAAGLAPWGNSLHLPMLSQVFEHSTRFDLIHCHLDYWSFPFARMVRTPTLTTLHGRLDIPQLFEVYRYYSDATVISISNAQRAPLPELNWAATVYHGVPADRLRFNPGPGKYLAFLGRIAPEKRVDLAIEIALRTKIPLKIAAKVDAVDREYFDQRICPLLGAEGVEFIGEIGEAEKSEFLGNAIALLFPVNWPEPFGLVMIEALACGTPVVARPCGSVPEVLRDGVTGFLGSSLDELVEAVNRISTIPRQQCRAEFEARYTASVMAANYERVYYQLINDYGTRALQNDGETAHVTREGVLVGEGTPRWPEDLEPP